MQDLVCSYLDIIDSIFYVASPNAIGNHQVNIAVDSKITGLIIHVGVVVPAALAHARDIIFVLIFILDCCLVQAVKIIASPLIAGFHFLYERVFTAVYSSLVTGENAHRIGVWLIIRRRFCRQGRQCKRSDHAQSYEYGCRFDK